MWPEEVESSLEWGSGGCGATEFQRALDVPQHQAGDHRNPRIIEFEIGRDLS